jgi:hypothetical protein
MTLEDAFMLVGVAAASFGGGAAIVTALIRWLADFFSKRTLQRDLHELGLAKASYDHYLDLILEYYRTFYKHYRLCQRAANADGHRQPDGQITYTQEDFAAGLDTFLVDWAAQEGKIRLLLPSRILAIHEEAIDCFNQFKRTIDQFRKNDATRKQKEEAFAAVGSVKSRMEDALRQLLRTEKLLK